jgi:hypothetical protein
MSRHALRIALAMIVLSAPQVPAAKTAHPAAYKLHALKGDTFTAPALLDSEFNGDYAKVAYVPAAASDAAATALQAAIPPAPQQELTYAPGGRTFKYFAIGDLTRPAKMIVIYVHGFGADRSQGVDEKRFGGNFGRLKRLVADNDGVYLSPDFSGYGRGAADQLTALIADYASRSPGAPVFVACISYGGGVCWRLAEAADASSRIRGVLIFGAPVDRGFLNYVEDATLPVYLGIGTKDAFASWKSADAFFRDVKTARPDFPIRLRIFDQGEHATAIRLTDWVETLNWMLGPRDVMRDTPIVPTAALVPPCPRPRPGTDGHAPASYCGKP